MMKGSGQVRRVKVCWKELLKRKEEYLGKGDLRVDKEGIMKGCIEDKKVYGK